MSFQDLKSKKNALQSLQKQVIEKQNSGTGKRDEREWRHTYDKTTKLGESTIRFLPFGDNERLPYAEWFEYSFKSPAGNYWNRSRTSIGEKDPVAELNSIQWERNLAGDRDAVKGRGRKKRYCANILVVNDPAHKENNGKVFIFKFGKAIHDKLMAALVPQYDSQKPIDIFDMWKGANFNIRTKEKSNFVNYDDSSFSPAGQLHPNEELLEKWYNDMYDLTEFESLDNYKSYEDLDKEMRKVLSERVVSGILGQEFNPAQSDNTGNAFNQAEQNQQQNVDPFAGQGQQKKQDDVDPFAGIETQPETQKTEEKTDPFAGIEMQTQTQTTEETTTSSSDEEDPFANLNI